MKKIAIVGAGVSGLSIGQMLKSSCQVEVFESSAVPGGLVSCDRIRDILFHKVGGHVFNSKNQEVLNWFWSFFDKENEFVSAKRNAKILMDGKLVGYPIENYLYQLDSFKAEAVIGELQSKGESLFSNPLDYPSFEMFLKDNFGEELYELYFRPYNEKIWNVDLSEVPMNWLEGKLPMPNVAEILKSYKLKQEETGMVHASFFYPKEGGSQFIANRLSEGLNVVYNTRIDRVVKTSSGYEINNKFFDEVVFTGNINNAIRLFSDFLPERLTLSLSQLKSNGTSNYLCLCDSNDLSWLYLPESKYKSHRIIFTGNFSSTNTPTIEDRTSCVVEFSGKVSPEEMRDEIANMPFHLTPIDYNYASHSYVIQDSYTRNVIGEARSILQTQNIHLLGRFAEWEYYNMDKAIEAAMQLKNVIG